LSTDRLALPVISLAFLFTGCMAVWARSTYGAEDQVVYRGTAKSCQELSGNAEVFVQGPFTWTLVLLDLPLTVVLDTVLLPFDMAWWLDPPRSITQPDD